MSGFAGAGTLLRAHLRRDRWMLLWWIGGTVLLYYSQAAGTDATYTSPAELAKAATAMQDNPALIAMAGPARALDTVGGQVAWQVAAGGAIVVGLMNMFLLGRHLRAEEEAGRDELVRSGVVTRSAPLVAAIALVVLADIAPAVLVAASLVAYGLPLVGTLALVVGMAGCALVFGAVALVAMQLTASTRPAYGITGIVIAASFVLRAVGDVGNGALSWCSPIGWTQAMWPYSGERWWPAALFVPTIGALVALALVLFAHRDVGAGMWSGRPGPAGGRLGAAGLAWRLQRGSVIGWSAGTFLMGLAYGSLGDSVGDIVGDGDLARDVLGTGGQDVVDGFHAASLAMVALLAGGFAVSSALRLHGEESDGHAEQLLATGLPRSRWWASHAVVVMVGSVVAVVGGGLGLGLGYTMVTGDGAAIGRLTVDAFGYAPATLALGGAALLVQGWVPRWSVVAWAPLVACVVVLLFGAVLQLPDVVVNASPFQSLARVPVEAWQPGPFVVVAVVTAALAGAGMTGILRRDLP